MGLVALSTFFGAPLLCAVRGTQVRRGRGRGSGLELVLRRTNVRVETIVVEGESRLLEWSGD